MIKILILTILATFLMAENPNAYSSIGNSIYNNSEKILSLKYIEQFKAFESKIDNYFFDVHEVKEIGFELDITKSPDIKKLYLKKLRKLLKINDYFLKTINVDFKKSMQKNDSKLFIAILNSGLLDLVKHKRSIISYYKSHKSEFQANTFIKNVLKQEKELRLAREARRRAIPTKEQLLKEKMRKIKAKDKIRRNAIEKHLQEELRLEKSRILKKQKENLSH